MPFRDSILAISPPFLTEEGGTAEAVQYAEGEVLDAITDWTIEGVQASMPGIGTPDALYLCGLDMLIDRGPNETDSHYAVRLQKAVDSHRIRGNPEELLRQLFAWFSPSTLTPIRLVSDSAVWHEINLTTEVVTKTVVGTNWTWDAFAWNGSTGRWHRGWVIIDSSAGPWRGDFWGDYCDQYASSNQDTQYTLTQAGVGTGAGQSFTGDGLTLAAAQFFLKKFGSATGNAVAKIYAHSGVFGTSSVPTGAALATSDNFDVSTLTTSYAITTLTFSGGNQIPLAAGTHYVVTIEYSGGSVGVTALNVGADSSSPTHPGNGSHFSTVWAADVGTDACFAVINTAGLWGDGGSWGSDATLGDVAALQRIVDRWKPAHITCMNIIVCFSSTILRRTDTSPPNPSGTSDTSLWRTTVNAAFWGGVS